MSTIDTGKHDVVGRLNGIPLYHPLERYDADFAADERHLVLGGGSGEHPAVVVPAITAAYAMLRHIVDRREGEGYRDYAGVFGLTAERIEALEEEIFNSALPVVNYSDWGGNEWHHFVKNAGSALHHTPFELNSEAIEAWLERAIGEIAFVQYPELIVECGLEQHADTVNMIAKLLAHAPLSGNVVALPASYGHAVAH